MFYLMQNTLKSRKKHSDPYLTVFCRFPLCYALVSKYLNSKKMLVCAPFEQNNGDLVDYSLHNQSLSFPEKIGFLWCQKKPYEQECNNLEDTDDFRFVIWMKSAEFCILDENNKQHDF